MYCPSCESLMPDDARYCGRCGMFLNARSERLVHLSQDFAWIGRRAWAGFISGFIGWIFIFVISRMIKQDAGPVVTNLFAGMVSGVYLGTVGGIVEESAYKAFLGGILGTVGGALGGLTILPVITMLSGNDRLFPLSFLVTWAIGGAFIGAVSGIIEKDRKKIMAGVLFGFIGGALGGFLGSILYGSIHVEFKPSGWLGNRVAEGLSGGLVGAVLWGFIGLIEKLYIFRRREDAKLETKICDACRRPNPLRFWYCGSCGRVLQTAAPRQKIAVTPFRGIERVANALKFLSWLFGVTGVIITPIIFFIFLLQDVFLAFVSAVFAVLATYLLVVAFRFSADLVACLVKISQNTRQDR